MRGDISLDLGKLDAADVLLTTDARIDALLVLWSRGGGLRTTIALDPDDLRRIAAACAKAEARYLDEIDRRDAEGAA